jgi:hypothetical protein
MPPVSSPLAPLRPVASRDRRRHAAAIAAGIALAMLSAACSVPEVDAPTSEADPSDAPIASSTPDPSEQRLEAVLEDLLATVTTARDALGAAQVADSAGARRDHAADALAALIQDHPGGGEVPGTGPLFPDQTTDREATDDADELLTRTLTVARDAGSRGAPVLELLRDPIAGDLGAWQRDAEGMLVSIETTVSGSATLERRDADVSELAGLGTRAIAWATLTAEADDPERARAYAERGEANLEVIAATLSQLDPLSGTSS